MLYGEQILISGITRHFQGFQRSASLFEACLPLSLPPKPPELRLRVAGIHFHLA